MPGINRKRRHSTNRDWQQRKKLIAAIDRNKERIENDVASNAKEVIKVDDAISTSIEKQARAQSALKRAKRKVENMKRKQMANEALASTLSDVAKPANKTTVPRAQKEAKFQKQLKLAELKEEQAKAKLERTKKIEQEANTAKRKMTKRMAKDKVKLESLTVVADQYSAVTASINKQEPLAKEEAQLAADEKVVTKAQEEAKMVKKTGK